MSCAVVIIELYEAVLKQMQFEHRSIDLHVASLRVNFVCACTSIDVCDSYATACRYHASAPSKCAVPCDNAPSPSTSTRAYRSLASAISATTAAKSTAKAR